MARKKLTEFNMNNIIGAAEELFMKKGFEATSVDDIAKLAENSKSTIYVYFRSKEEIFDHIVLSYMQKMLEFAEVAKNSEGDFDDRYFRLCMELDGLYVKSPLFFKGTLGNISVDLERELYKNIYEVGESINETIADFIRQGIAEGKVRKDIDVYTAVFTMWSSIAGIVSFANEKREYLKMRFGIDKFEYIKRACGLLLEGIR